MKIFETDIRVRYSETDQMGFVYHGNYARYFEIGRVEALRSIGLTYKQVEEQYNTMMPVINMEVHYLRAAKYDDLIKVQTRITSVDKWEMTFSTAILGEDNKIINKGTVKLCYIDSDSKKRINLNPELLELITFHSNN